MVYFFKKLIRKILPEKLICFFWHKPMAILAASINGFPARKLIAIAIAGTKGKTTTCYLAAQILEAAGRKTAMVSTALIKIGKREELNKVKMTTPSPFFLQRFLKEAVRAGCRYAIIEVSSHALAQHRTFGISFQAVVLTNLMPDHLDYHKTAKAYQEIHGELISPHLKTLIVNSDDRNLLHFTKLIPAKTIYFGKESPLAFELKKINPPFFGEFNFYNAMAAAAVGLSQDINLDVIKDALIKTKPTPGRLEKIDEGQDFATIVDYAHSPDSLKNLYRTVMPETKGRIITVFGACGDRDQNQRPLMGEIIAKNSDFIVATNDDPYFEDPEKISEQLLSGILLFKKLESDVWKILDRREAIRKALSLAKKDDLVLILGKGAEQWQVFGNKKIPWDDRRIARELLAERQKTPR